MTAVHWLIVMSEDNWEVCERLGLVGLGRDAERRFQKMADGDRVWVYLNRRHVDRQVPRVNQIRALVRLVGPIQHLRKSPWKARGDQTFAVARPIVVEKTLAIPAIEVLKQLSFAGPSPIWGGRLLHAPLRLTEDDVAKLQAAAIRASGSNPV